VPAKTKWLLHVGSIRALLETLDFPVIDRAMVESLFGLRRRRAIELLHRFGGFQAGRTFLIDRLKLIEALKQIEGGAEFGAESRRRQKLQQCLEEAQRWHKARIVKIEVRQDEVRPRPTAHSDGVDLIPGHLHIEFAGTEDLLSKLYRLSQAAAHDYDAFVALSEGAGQGSRRPLLD